MTWQAKLLLPVLALCVMGSLPAAAQSGSIRFARASLTASEGVGVVLIELERTSSNAGAKITFQTAGITAVSGTDFHPISETHTFPAGQTNLSLALQILDNPQFQTDRALRITLSNPVDLTIGSPGEITITIADNDEVDRPGSGAAGTNLVSGAFTLATNSTGAITLGGSFRTYNGELRSHLARILPSGGLDPGFDAGTGPNDRVWALAVEADDDLLIAGDFTSVDGQPRGRIARLHNSGTIDTSFAPGTGANRLIESIELLPDGRILIAGFFTTYNGTARSDVAILQPTGTLDTSFNAVTPPSFVGHVARKHGDHYLVGGEVGFGIDANVTNALMRFDAAGVRDTTFQVSIGDIALNRVSGIIVQPDQKIVICGDFLGVNGQPSSSVARLNPNGTLDSSFNVGLGADNWVFRITRQVDGKFLIAGFFQNVDGKARAGIARLNANGSLDESFHPGSGADDVVYHAIDGGDRLLVAGGFSTLDGYDRFGFAELDFNGALRTEPVRFLQFSPAPGAALNLKLAVEPGRNYRLLTSPAVTGGWSAVLTNRTARRSIEWSQPLAGSPLFLRAEQEFEAP